MAQLKRLTELPEKILDMILWEVSKMSSIYSMMWLREVCSTCLLHTKPGLLPPANPT
jgi:hypothetical protein